MVTATEAEKNCNGMVTSLPLLSRKSVRIAGEEGELSDGEGGVKGRWKMKERRGEILRVVGEIEGS
jgi:hypothetical protein